MTKNNQHLFRIYVFSGYKKNRSAIKNKECLEFAKRIIDFWDEYYLENPNRTKEEDKEHLLKYKDILLEELCEDSTFIEEVKKEISNKENGCGCQTKVMDHLLRIRAVFGIDDLNNSSNI